MRNRQLALIATAVLALPIVLAQADGAAADSQPKAPATQVPLRMTLADFARHPRIGNAKISPDGSHLAILVPVGEETRLDVIDLSTMKATAAYNLAQHVFIIDFSWIDESTLIWAPGVRDGPLDELYYTGDLMVGEAKNSHGWRMSSSGERFLAREPGHTDSVLVAGHGGVYRAAMNGSWGDLVAKVPYDQWHVLLDHDSNVRMVVGEDDADNVTAMWDPKALEWQELRRAHHNAGTLTPLAFAADQKHFYALSNVETPTTGVYLLEPAAGTGSLLFRDPRVDINHILYMPGSKEPGGVLTYPDYPEYHFFEDNGPLAKTYAELRGAFPGCAVLITSSSDDGHLAIVSVTSDTRSEELYLLDTRKLSLQRLFSSRPWIDSNQMSPKTAFAIKARDGMELHGYLTLPRDAGETGLPMVVLPHGGPHGVRDSWDFDAEVQMLAYNGYAVLQLNYRGSGGYGLDFENIGYGHWGTTMQDDLTDATLWAIHEGVADRNRICIYGASYGGYAALMGVIREPDLYRCAIGYAGAYDLTVQRKKSDTAKTKRGRVYFDEALGKDPADLKARSPVYNVDRIKVPLLLVHGGDDERVPIKNFRELTSALDKAGKTYETLVKSNEVHGFYKEQNVTEFYTRLLDFLERSIGSKRTQPARTDTAQPESVTAPESKSTKP